MKVKHFKVITNLSLLLCLILLGNAPSAIKKTVNVMAYPNPYNPDTHTLKITQLNKVVFGSSVKFIIYDMNFRKVYNDTQSGTLLWHGYTKFGVRVPPGLYFLEVVEEEVTGSEKTYGRKIIKLLIK